MTQQLSLFDLGDPVQPEPKKKAVAKRTTAQSAQNDHAAESFTATATQQEEQIPEPMQFCFFVADDIVAAIQEETSAETKPEAVDSSTKEMIALEVIATEDFSTQTETEEEIIDEQIAPAAIYQPDEKITVVRKRGRKSFKEIDAEIDLISIPEDEELFKKQYYSITEVAKWFRVNNSLLRFWENEFPVLKPRKNKKGDRLFRPEDIKNLQVIYYLLRQRKFTIDGARKYMKAHKENIEVNLKLIQSLNKFKGFLLELKANTE